MLRMLRERQWNDPRDDCELMRYCFKGGGGGTTTTTNVQSQDLPEFIKPYYTSGLTAAEEDILYRPTEFFPGQTYADFSPETELALAGQTGRALAGSPLLGQSQDYTSSVLAGDYLSPTDNPFFSQLSDAVRAEVQPAVTGRFARAGRTGGSPLETEAIGRGVSRGLAPYLFSEYGRERGAMEAAASRAPQLAREDYFDIGQLGRVGAAREGQTQRGIDEAMARFGFGQNEPTNRVLTYMSALQGVPVGLNTVSTQTGTSQQNVNPWLYGTGTALRAGGTLFPMGVQGK